MVLGTALILGALSLYIYNWREAKEAEQSVLDLMPKIIAEIEDGEEDSCTNLDDAGTESAGNNTDIMPQAEIDGYAYMGYLSIPQLNLELPVMADWDYSRLKISPCRYSGSIANDDLVIIAHNYTRHFGTLSELSENDKVIFTDMNGTSIEYEVAALDILSSDAVEEITSGDFDLTLFTCTYGGKNRVTVFCNRTEYSER